MSKKKRNRQMAKKVYSWMLSGTMAFSAMSVMPGNIMASEPSLLNYWTEDPLVRTTKLYEPPQRVAQNIDIFAAKNEYENSQIVVNSKMQDFTITGVEFTNLVNERSVISKENLEYTFALYEIADTTVTGFAPGGEFANGLDHRAILQTYPANVKPDPLSKQPAIDVKKGENQPIYITTYIHKDTVPGEYYGRVTVKTTLGDIVVPMKLEVLDTMVTELKDSEFTCVNWFFDLGQSRVREWNEYKNIYGVEENHSAEQYEILGNWLDVMTAHRQNAATISPVFMLDDANTTIDEKGIFTFDWSLFDKTIDLYLTKGLTEVVGMHAGYANGGYDYRLVRDPEKNDGSTIPGIDVYNNNDNYLIRNNYQDAEGWYEQYYTELAKHIESYDITKYPQFEGTDKKTLFDIWSQHLTDECTNQRYYETLLDLFCEYFVIKDETGNIVKNGRSVDSDHGILINTPSINAKAAIVTPQLDVYNHNREKYQARMAAGGEVWSYICLNPGVPYLNRFVRQPDTVYPLLYWYWANEGLTGYLHYALNGWSLGWFLDGDSYIVYPDADNKTFMTSIRYEGQRDGLEDYELIQIAQEKNPVKTQEILDATAKYPNKGYVTEAWRFRMLRRALVEVAAYGETAVDIAIAVSGDKPESGDLGEGQYKIKVEPTVNGEIFVEKFIVNEGEDLKIVLVPDAGYEIKSLWIDGKSVELVGNTYVSQDVRKDLSIRAEFGTSKDTNIVVGKEVTLLEESQLIVGKPLFAPSNITDDNLNTGFSNNGGVDGSSGIKSENLTLEIDLKGTFDINKLEVYAMHSGNYRIPLYNIEYKNSASDEWQLAYTSTCQNWKTYEDIIGMESTTLGVPITATHIRFQIPKDPNYTVWGGVQIQEIKAYGTPSQGVIEGTNIARGKVVTPSELQVQLGDNKPSDVVDGDFRTGYANFGGVNGVDNGQGGIKTNDLTLEIDLEGNFEIHQFNVESLNSGEYHVPTYTMQYKNGLEEEWQDAYTTVKPAGRDSVKLTIPIVATHVRFLIPKNPNYNSWGGVVIYEIEVYGKPESGVVNPKVALKQLIGVAEAKNPEDYTQLSYRKMLEVVERSKECLYDNLVTVEEVEASQVVLQQAIEQLVEKSLNIQLNVVEANSEGYVKQTSATVTVNGAKTLSYRELGMSESQDMPIVNEQVVLTGLEEKTYLIEAVDDAGQICDAIIHVDVTKPQVTGVTDQATYYNTVTLQMVDEHLKTISINGKRVPVFGKQETVKLKEEGTYQVIVTDKADHETQVTFNIYRKTELYLLISEAEGITQENVPNEEWEIFKQVIQRAKDVAGAESTKEELKQMESELSSAITKILEIKGQKPEEKDPEVYIVGEKEAVVGQPYQVSIGLETAKNPIYAQEFVVTYDQSLFELKKCTMLNETQHVADASEAGRIRVLTVTPNQAISGQEIMKLEFDVIAEGEATSAIQITGNTGLVTQKEGVVTSQLRTLAGKEHSVEVGKQPVPEEEGDINGDAKVDIADLAMIAYYYQRNSEDPQWEEIKKADVNGDGKINIDDLTYVANKILKQ